MFGRLFILLAALSVLWGGNNAMPTTYSVAVDWDIDGSYATAGDDVTAFTIMARSQQGMIEERARIANIGTLDLVLDNSDKRFSPLNASGAYYGKLLPMRPVRVQATDGITTWTVFEGFTRKFIPEPDAAGGLKRCTVQCEDILGILQRAKISLPLQTDKTMSELLLLIGAEAFKTGQATGSFTLSAQPTAGETITVGDQTYTFRDTVSAANDIKIGTVGDAELNLAAAINGSTGEGTQYGNNTDRHPLVTATPIPLNGEVVQTNNGPLGYLYSDLAQMLWFEENSRTLGTVKLYLFKLGSPSDVTVSFQTNSGGLPSGTLVDANATATLTAAEVGTSYNWVTITFPGSFTVHPSDYLVLEYTGVNDIANNYSWGRNVGNANYKGFGAYILYAGGSWTEAPNSDFDFLIPGTITIDANCRGAWGNSIALAETGAEITKSGATLTGGTDDSISHSYQTGRTTYPYAGDTWSENKTNALVAMGEVVSNEPGLLWCARDGTLTAKDRQWIFAQTATAAALTLNNVQIGQEGDLDDERIANHVIVSYTPRGEQTNQVVAQANYIIAVPGRSTTTRWSKTAGYTAGVKTVRLSFTIPDTGTLAGAKDIIHPVPNTDYTVFDFADGSGFNYTTNGVLSMSMVTTGSGVEVTFSNIATGTLYVLGFQVRGTRLVTYETKEVTREDNTSIAIYGRRTLRVQMTMATDENLATAYANHLLGRYKNPTYIVSSETVQDANLLIGGVHPQSIEIGSVLSISETQTGVNAAKYLVQGIENTIQSAGQKASTVWHVRPLGDVTYWILNDATYGILGSTTRLAI